jgi:hypothetical protein
VFIQGGMADLRCFAITGGAQTSSTPLGPTSCNQAALAKIGNVAAVSFIDTVATTNGDEGVLLVDLATKRTTKFPIDTTYPNIRIDGPYIYAACVLGTCQFKLRR